MLHKARLIITMGVSGGGKSTIGEKLAEAYRYPYLDADDYHSKQAVAKMRQGIPLDDSDRWPWLSRIAKAMITEADRHGAVIASCSALKRAYRDFLTGQAGEPVLFINLYAPIDVIADRQANRAGHFMPASLLKSQYDTLEMPQEDENAVTIDVSGSIEETLKAVHQVLGDRPRPASGSNG